MGEIFNVSASKILGETYNIFLIYSIHSLWLLKAQPISCSTFATFSLFIVHLLAQN